MSRLNQDIAAAQVKAALLALLQAHSTDKIHADAVTATLILDDGAFAEGQYSIEALVGQKPMPIAGGSL